MPTDLRTSIAPLLSVRRGVEAVEFYKAAFGAVEVYRVEAPDGAVVSRLSVDGRSSGSPTSRPSTATSAPRRSAAARPD